MYYSNVGGVGWCEGVGGRTKGTFESQLSLYSSGDICVTVHNASRSTDVVEKSNQVLARDRAAGD